MEVTLAKVKVLMEGREWAQATHYCFEEKIMNSTHASL